MELKPWKELSLNEHIEKSYDNFQNAVLNGDEQQIKKWRGALHSYLYKKYELERIAREQPELPIIE